MNTLQAIHKSFKNDRVIYSSHARQEMLKEEFGRVYEEEVYESLGRGKIIERYPKDKPYPSFLVSGYTLNKSHYISLSLTIRKMILVLLLQPISQNPGFGVKIMRGGRNEMCNL